ncbi:hypothetical protein RND71_036674 [Anisodus tanguticus]|uniref:Uncharacterized protein n=1 Tax=Anisodus tanguticus TaxID=243964 RepID=A0AAE1R1G0_9SOLA|nr:hypothetical protein RND71_036674 [Anisodus tanguticus]
MHQRSQLVKDKAGGDVNKQVIGVWIVYELLETIRYTNQVIIRSIWVLKFESLWDGNNLLISDEISLMHHISIYLSFDPGESAPPCIPFESLNAHLDKSRCLPITLYSGTFSLVDICEIANELLASPLSNFNSLVVSFSFNWHAETQLDTTTGKKESLKTSVVPTDFLLSPASHKESWLILFPSRANILPHDKKVMMACNDPFDRYVLFDYFTTVDLIPEVIGLVLVRLLKI